MQVVVDGLITQYDRIGSGEPILILHGWGDSSNGWLAFAQRLAAEHYEVIVCDLPGFGGTQKPETAWDLTNYAKFVQAFENKIGVQAYAIIGHSNGGAIAIRGLSKDLLHTERLILLASAGVRGESNRSGLAAATKMGKVLSAPLPKSWQKKLRTTLYTKAGSDMLVAEHLEDTFKQVVTDDVREDASKVHVQALLMYGSDDTATPVQYGQIFHKAITGSQLVIVPGAGHFVHIDAEEKVLATVKDFLK